MLSSRAMVALTVLLAVVALALAAPVLSDMETPGEGDGTGEGQGPDEGGERGNGIPVEIPESDDDPVSLPEIAALLLLVALIATIVLMLVFGIRRILVSAVVVLLAAVVVLTLLSVVGDLVELPSLGNETAAEQKTDEESGGGADGDGTAVTVTSFGTLFVLLLASLLGVAVFYRFASTDSADEPSGVEKSTSTTAVGHAAGRAAERIDETSLENAVYQAWHEMTDALDVTRADTMTPAEFATVAVDAGMDPNDVETLTELFQEVRYGNTTVTDEREGQARETLRRIETTYTAEQSDGGWTSDGGKTKDRKQMGDGRQTSDEVDGEGT